MMGFDYVRRDCTAFQACLDSFLNGELNGNTICEVARHLKACLLCYQALLIRQRLRDHLQRAVRRESAPPTLQEKIKSSLRQNAAPKFA